MISDRPRLAAIKGACSSTSDTTELVVKNVQSSFKKMRRVLPPREAAKSTLASTASCTAFFMQLVYIGVYLFLGDAKFLSLRLQFAGSGVEDLTPKIHRQLAIRSGNDF